MANISQVAQMHLPTFGDYGPISASVDNDGLRVDIYPLRDGKYLAEGKKDDLYGGWDFCINTRHHSTPGIALNSMLHRYGKLYSDNTFPGNEYEVHVSSYSRKEKRNLFCVIKCDNNHTGWYETHGYLGDISYDSPGAVLNAYLDSVLPEPYAKYVYARGTLGKL